MHILVVNDDGPPSPHSSPYVHSLVRELQTAGHVVSVCLPHTQRSWIGKAHMIGQTVKPLYYRPPPLSSPSSSSSSSSLPAGLGPADDETAHGTTHGRPSADGTVEEWVLVDGTPASCVQIGLYHYFSDRGPVDLVVSGPNYGRNTTAVFALSSGTLGGALEAAACGKRAVALSYAFFSRNHDPEIVAGASKHGVRVIEALVRQWPTDGSVDVYSVNVPLVEGVGEAATVFAPCLQNYWTAGNSAFEAVSAEDSGDADEEEERIRRGEMNGATVGEGDEEAKKNSGHVHRHFKWAPQLGDVMKATAEAPSYVDGQVVRAGKTSVTALKANFWHAAEHLHEQELKLDVPEEAKITALPLRPAEEKDILYAIVDYEDPYVQPIILSALQSLVPPSRLRLLPANATAVPPGTKLLQIRAYEAIDFDRAMASPSTSLINSYIIRKALIRKHFLSATVDHWVAKNPTSSLRAHVRRGEAFEVDYAEFLDDALVEAFDLRASLEANEEVGSDAAEKREWWILKPSMSDRGQGIRLFSTMDELQGIFDGWEEDEPSSDDDDEEEEEDEDQPGDDDNGQHNKDYITTSHLRHFVAQPYIHPPLLLPSCDNRKFHIRTYVLCAGAMRVYVCREMLALFAARPYSPPWETTDPAAASYLDAHLTNTCLQGPRADALSVQRFWDLDMDPALRQSIFSQICEVSGEVFEAAARVMMVHFQPLPFAFEVYGLDFLVDAAGTPWLLEVNAFPDFKQTGHELRETVVAGFWRGALRLGVGSWAGVEDGGAGAEGDDDDDDDDAQMVLVREIDLGRR
ncbi:sure-like protein [Cryphonectria parasitica EP155]|uniref:Sure-like protein n=1 Tax=Cryphonectria parasitica (strain ATCC 38755 / EP155) TaxID=660469 RepID=A0A9P4XVA2_CRYP1|nr:sure-like protein [Cryphonectria parasitica EP155]KAF3761472.1 sure-like protein [Cryphonectria parasitica EP155]